MFSRRRASPADSVAFATVANARESNASAFESIRASLPSGSAECNQTYLLFSLSPSEGEGWGEGDSYPRELFVGIGVQQRRGLDPLRRFFAQEDRGAFARSRRCH